MWCVTTDNNCRRVAGPPGYNSVASSASNVSVSYEPSDNTVSLLYTPPWLTPDTSSPRDITTESTVTVGGYKTVPVSEPDLSRLPERSALKGGKTRHRLKQQSSETEQNPLTSSQDSPHSVTHQRHEKQPSDTEQSPLISLQRSPRSVTHRSPQKQQKQASETEQNPLTSAQPGPQTVTHPCPLTSSPRSPQTVTSSQHSPRGVTHRSPPAVTTTAVHPAAVQFMSAGVLPQRVPPKVAPKPRTGP